VNTIADDRTKSLAPVPICASITLTPASPQGSGPSIRRKPSFRGPSTRPARPTSLLQRGRSFTASDLQAEASSGTGGDILSAGEGSPRRGIVISESPVALEPVALPLSVPPRAPRLTRSFTSSAIYNPHSARDSFLATTPSTSDRSVLAIPLSLEPQTSHQPKSTSGWSDSEDEKPTAPRMVKKLKGGVKGRVKGANLASNQFTDGGLRSPFEEKDFAF
jgi:hypothetical protein